MSKAFRLRRALDEQKADRWQCQTCSAPADEGSSYCRYCAMYWEDVSNGLFEEKD